MGRRSINTTKSGKYMNPTDQARKEARKKELKKNKKQRQMVRQAVLKGKDPIQIIAEMEKIDTMEYNVLQPAPLNEKVLKDKRRKLRETLDRVLKLYQKEDSEKWEEVKRIEAEYEKRRLNLVTYSEAVRHAQQVQVDDIPLPLAGGIPLPELPPPSILRKRSAYSPPRSGLSLPSPLQLINKRPPGVPPGPPPELSSDEEDHSSLFEEKARRIRFAENESDESDDENILDHLNTGIPPPLPVLHHRVDELPPGMIPPPPSLPAPTGQLPIGLPPARPLGVLGMRPPGPPPGLPPRLLPPIRLPPGPPPGLPRVLPPRMTPNVLTAAPQLIRKDAPQISLSKGPTIEAKAQIRNLSADITRFVPTALRVKRIDDKIKPSTVIGRPPPVEQPKEPSSQPVKPQPKTKDDAYSQFMRELEGLL